MPVQSARLYRDNTEEAANSYCSALVETQQTAVVRKRPCSTEAIKPMCGSTLWTINESPITSMAAACNMSWAASSALINTLLCLWKPGAICELWGIPHNRNNSRYDWSLIEVWFVRGQVRVKINKRKGHQLLDIDQGSAKSCDVNTANQANRWNIKTSSFCLEMSIIQLGIGVRIFQPVSCLVKYCFEKFKIGHCMKLLDKYWVIMSRRCRLSDYTYTLWWSQRLWHTYCSYCSLWPMTVGCSFTSVFHSGKPNFVKMHQHWWANAGMWQQLKSSVTLYNKV